MDSADYLAYKPFSRRLIAIRAEEIEEFTMYSEKYLTIEKEARAILQNIDDKSVMEKMIDRAILFTYLHFRTIMSLTVLFHRVEHKDCIRSLFSSVLYTRSKHHHPMLILILRRFMNEGLIDEIDCAMNFNGRTLKALDVIPCMNWFDRRVKHWQKTIKCVNSESRHQLTSRQVKGMGIEASTVFQVILDFLMNEIEHNHLFWLHLIEQCSGDLALPPATFIKLVGTALHQLVNNRYAINTNAYKKRKSTAMHDERLRKKRQVGGLPEENDQKKEDGHEDDNEQKSTDNNIQENNNQTGDNENNEINKNSVIPEEKEPDDKKETGEKKKTFYK